MKKIIKILIFFSLILFNIYNVLALDANISLSNEKININDYVKLKITIESDKGGEIDIKKITGIENFEIIGTSQSQSSYSNVVIVNGKAETKTKMTNNFNLTLEAKETGDFELGPVIIDDGTSEVETNKVNINVSGSKIFINNNQQNIKNNTNNINTLFKQKKDDFENKDNGAFNYYFIIISFGILILIGFIFFIIKKNYNNILKLVKNFILKIKTDKIKENELIKEDDTKNNIDFESYKIESIYPDIGDNLFSIKIDQIFRNKLSKRFKINVIENKTYSEILEIINEKSSLEEKDKILNIIKLLNKVKYSNLIADNNKLLDLVKNLFE